MLCKSDRPSILILILILILSSSITIIIITSTTATSIIYFLLLYSSALSTVYIHMLPHSRHSVYPLFIVIYYLYVLACSSE